MTFVKPSTITTQAGAYNYKGNISSPSQNYIDNQFPNCLDKTNGDIISGSITFAAGSTLIVDGTATANIQIGNGGILEVESGGNLLTDSGSFTTFNGEISVNSTFNVGTNTILFGASAVPVITQTTPVSAGGTQFKIQAQNGSNGVGGRLTLQAGSGSGSNNGGDVLINTGSSASGLPGSFIVNQNTKNILEMGTAGIQTSGASITVGAAGITLTSQQYNFPLITLSGTLTSSIDIVFPSGFGPTYWFVSASGVSFNPGTEISFECSGFGTAGNSLNGSHSIAIVFIDGSNNMSALLGN